MEQIKNLMMELIKSRVCGAELHPSLLELTGDTIEYLYHVSKAHDVVHLLTAPLEACGLLDAEAPVGKYQRQTYTAIWRYERMQHELDAVCRVLEDARIMHLPLKGSVMRRYYPEPWMRTSTDIDVLVPREKTNEAAEILVKELGYRNDGVAEHDVQLVSPSGVHLELHFDTIEGRCSVNSRAVMSRIWEYARVSEGYEYRCEVSDDMFYFYHVAHMEKHFESAGCGVRFFLDMWLLNHRCEFDRAKREALLREGGLLAFARAAERLSEVWFSDAEHDELTRRMEQYVFRGGVFGGKDNRIATQQVRMGGRIGYFFYLVFLPYREMRRKYPSLERFKFLLPFYHIHRWFSLIFRGRVSSSVQILKHSGEVADTQTEEIARMLGELELL